MGILRFQIPEAVAAARVAGRGHGDGGDAEEDAAHDAGGGSCVRLVVQRGVIASEEEEEGGEEGSCGSCGSCGW